MQVIVDEEEKREIREEEEETVRHESPNQWLLVIKRLQRNRVATLAFYYIMANILIAVFYPLIIPNGLMSIAPGRDGPFGGGTKTFPNLKYPFGTDQKGYDTFARVLAGAQTSILVGVFATAISVFLGVLVGLLAGYYKGYIEEVLMRLADLFLAVPFLIIALLLLRIINKGHARFLEGLSHVAIITLLIGIFGWAGLSRLVTANVKQVTNLEYVHAVKIMGAKDRRIIFLHVLPNVLAPIIVLAALAVATSILSEAGLAFLGFADPSNTISWGVNVSINRSIFPQHPDQVLIPGFAIFFLVLAINIFGDTLRDALDPRLKQ